MLATIADMEILNAKVDHNSFAKQDIQNRAQHECSLVDLLLKEFDIANIAKEYNAICDKTDSIWRNLQCPDSKSFTIDLHEI